MCTQFSKMAGEMTLPSGLSKPPDPGGMLGVFC